MRDEMITQLHTILVEEMHCLAHAVMTADLLQEALKDHNVDAVAQTAKLFDNSQESIMQLEQQREEICLMIVEQQSIKPHQMNLRGIIDLLPTDQRDQFTTLHLQLKQSIQTLGQVMSSNELLARESLQVITKAIVMKMQPLKICHGYQAKGNKCSFQSPNANAVINTIG